jgi:uncharacterized protein YkwD
MSTRRSALAPPLSVALAAALVVALVAAFVAAGAAAARPRVEPRMAEAATSGELEPGASPSALDAARRDVLARVNEARRRAGRGALSHRAALELAASRHAADMVARGYFAHESPEGRTARERADEAGYGPALLVGETIAYGQRTAGAVVTDWLASAPHRRVLLDRRFAELGVGIAIARQGDRVKITWVAVAAAPRPRPGRR